MKMKYHQAAISVAVLSSVLALGGAVAWQVGIPQRLLSKPSDVAAAEGKDGQVPEAQDRAAPVVSLAPAQLTLAGVQSMPAAPGLVSKELILAGEVKLNEDRLVHVAPRLTGMVREARKVVGDTVQAGEALVTLDSRELADAKSAILTARERLILAQTTFEREERLWKAKISAEQDYLEAKQGLAEAKIEMRTADQKLHALGFTDPQIQAVGEEHSADLTGYQIAAPLAGTIIEKHAAPNEHVQAESQLYTICDLGTVWVTANVNTQDLALIQKGQSATFSVDAYPDRVFEGQVSYIAEALDEQTRTLKIRMTVANPELRLKAGMFVRVALAVESRQTVVSVPAAAVQTQKDASFVFVDLGSGKFERRPIKVGLQSAQAAEVLDGLQAHDRVVVAGAFALKSELNKASFEAD